MACTVPEFRIRFVEFQDDMEFPDATIQMHLDDVVLLYMGTDEKRWNGKYDIAHCYHAAHVLVGGMASEAGSTSPTSGPITNKSAGGVSVSRASTQVKRSTNEDWLMGTTYGQRFLTIRNMCFAGVSTAAPNATS